MAKWIGCQDQGGGVRQIAELFGHSDNAEPGIRDQASRPSLFPTDSKEAINPQQVGTKCAAQYALSIPAGETRVIRLRLRPSAAKSAGGDVFGDFDTVMQTRSTEADAFYHAV